MLDSGNVIYFVFRFHVFVCVCSPFAFFCTLTSCFIFDKKNIFAVEGYIFSRPPSHQLPAFTFITFNKHRGRVTGQLVSVLVYTTHCIVRDVRSLTYLRAYSSRPGVARVNMVDDKSG